MVRDIFSTCFHPRQPLPLDLERSVSDEFFSSHSAPTCSAVTAATRLQNMNPRHGHLQNSLSITDGVFSGGGDLKEHTCGLPSSFAVSQADGGGSHAACLRTEQRETVQRQAPLVLGLPIFRCHIQVIFNGPLLLALVFTIFYGCYQQLVKLYDKTGSAIFNRWSWIST